MIDLTAINPLPNSFERLLALTQKQERIAKFARPRPAEQRLASEVEHKIAQRIRALGYSVWPTPNNWPFDLYAGGARVEVKASKWQTGAGRYQAAIRNHQSDLLIFDAINGTDHIFIIPMRLVIPNRTVEITRYQVDLYSGRWAAFLENWQYLHEAIEQSPPRPVQLELWTCPDMNIS